MSERSSKNAYVDMKIMSAVRKLLAINSSAIVANSASGVAYWRRQRFVDKRSVHIIRNAIDLDSIKNTVPVQSGAERKFEILGAGRLISGKGFETIVEAIPLCERRREISVKLYGAGDLRERRAMINSVKASDAISINSYHQNWWGILKSAKLLVSMSEFEGAKCYT